MTWRWLIFFSAIWLGAGNQPQPLRGGDVTGSVELAYSSDPATRRNHNYSGVVLWLEPVVRLANFQLVPQRATMEQRNKQFSPHVLAIPAGSTVDFPNRDEIMHNVFSVASGQTFDLSLYAGGQSRSVTFRYTGIARIYCNIHSTMSAIIAVLDTPWYAVTPASGKFVIPNVPPGEYVLHIFHERALQKNLEFLQHRVTVSEDGLALPLITVSETGYVQPPHPDKHGQPYPQPSRYPVSGGGGN